MKQNEDLGAFSKNLINSRKNGILIVVKINYFLSYTHNL